MKFISGDKEKILVELTNEDYHRLFQIAQSVNQEYDCLDDGILELTKEEVKEFKDGVVSIMHDRHKK